MISHWHIFAGNIDCRRQDYGNDYFKGRYHFQRADVGTYVDATQMYCKYGNIKGNSTVKRLCFLNATWDKVDLSFCRTKDEEEIRKVQKLAQVIQTDLII